MKALVIDDEVHCRNVVKKMVEIHCPEIGVVHEADSMKSGLEKIKKLNPDLVFLDIQLNDLTGFDLLDQLEKIDFQLIFTTAYDNYAVKAFEYSAVHYLLKPIAPSDLMEAVKRCLSKELTYNKELIDKTKGFYLRTHENSYDIIYDQIKYIRADGSYSTIYSANGKNIFTSKKLGDYNDLLSTDFFRIHHSIIVNMNFVDRIDRKSMSIILKDETKLPLSRRRKKDFKDALDNFIV